MRRLVHLASVLTGTVAFLGLLVATSGLPAAASTGPQPGPNDAITDVPGIQVGQYTRTDAPYLTGTTVVYTPDGAFGGVDVAGGAPGTRETDELDPRDEVQNINAVTLSGGSAYGLASADGVMTWLEQHNKGFPVGSQPGQVVPLVPSAIIYDLNRGGSFTARPDANFGYNAIDAATAGPVAQGDVGAGTGAISGGLKGGVGTASVDLGNGIVVGALIAVNSVGSAVNPQDCGFYARSLELGNEFGNLHLPTPAECAAWRTSPAGRNALSSSGVSPMNTTIGVVATNATLTKTQAWKMAQVAQDGQARALLPVHTLFDGDTIFAMSTHKLGLDCSNSGCTTNASQPLIDCQFQTAFEPQASGACDSLLTQIYTAAANAVSRAIMRAYLSAKSIDGYKSYCDTFPHACQSLSAAAASRASTRPARLGMTRTTVQVAESSVNAGPGLMWPMLVMLAVLAGAAGVYRRRLRSVLARGFLRRSWARLANAERPQAG